MKNRFLTVLLSATVILLASSINVSAQFGNKDDWKERMQSEKIAFLTMEIGLTPDEAQKFWPIYNMVSDDMDKAMHEVFSSYMELEKALNEEKSDKEISKYLERYLDALEKQNEIRDDSVEEYRKILTDKKVAKIFVAEEKFRRQHIRRLHERSGEKK
jgi:Spy/CpxP family protein refolding chaperone